MGDIVTRMLAELRTAWFVEISGGPHTSGWLLTIDGRMATNLKSHHEYHGPEIGPLVCAAYGGARDGRY